MLGFFISTLFIFISKLFTRETVQTLTRNFYTSSFYWTGGFWCWNSQKRFLNGFLSRRGVAREETEYSAEDIQCRQVVLRPWAPRTVNWAGGRAPVAGMGLMEQTTSLSKSKQYIKNNYYKKQKRKGSRCLKLPYLVRKDGTKREAQTGRKG